MHAFHVGLCRREHQELEHQPYRAQQVGSGHDVKGLLTVLTVANGQSRAEAIRVIRSEQPTRAGTYPPA
jgi:hypothetical protein